MGHRIRVFYFDNLESSYIERNIQKFDRNTTITDTRRRESDYLENWIRRTWLSVRLSQENKRLSLQL